MYRWSWGKALSFTGFPVMASSSTVSLSPREDFFAFDVCGDGFNTGDLIFRAREDVAIQDNQVGPFAWLQRANFGFEEQEPRVVDGVEANGLLARERLFEVHLAVEPFCAARHGGGNAKERIVGIVAAVGADLLHVVGAATGGDAC